MQDLPQHLLYHPFQRQLYHQHHLSPDLHHSLLSPPLPPRVKRLHSHVGGSIQEVTATMFAKVSREVTKRLEEVFRLDLQMFGYLPY